MPAVIFRDSRPSESAKERLSSTDAFVSPGPPSRRNPPARSRLPGAGRNLPHVLPAIALSEGMEHPVGAALEPEAGLPAAGARHQPRQLRIDPPGVDDAPHADIQPRPEDRTAHRLRVGRRQVERVVHEVEVAATGFPHAPEPFHDPRRRPSPDRPSLDQGIRAVGAIHGAAAPGLDRDPEVPGIDAGRDPETGIRQGKIVQVLIETPGDGRPFRQAHAGNVPDRTTAGDPVQQEGNDFSPSPRTPMSAPGTAGRPRGRSSSPSPPSTMGRGRIPATVTTSRIASRRNFGRPMFWSSMLRTEIPTTSGRKAPMRSRTARPASSSNMRSTSAASWPASRAAAATQAAPSGSGGRFIVSLFAETRRTFKGCSSRGRTPGAGSRVLFPMVP